MVQRFITRFGTIGIALFVAAVALVGGVSGAAIEHARLTTQNEQQAGQQVEQTGNHEDGQGSQAGSDKGDTQQEGQH